MIVVIVMVVVVVVRRAYLRPSLQARLLILHLSHIVSSRPPRVLLGQRCYYLVVSCGAAIVAV